MAKCKKGKTVGCHLSFDIAKALEEHSENIGWSVSRYLAYMAETWYANGCPPINNIEEGILMAQAKERSMGAHRIKRRV